METSERLSRGDLTFTDLDNKRDTQYKTDVLIKPSFFSDYSLEGLLSPHEYDRRMSILTLCEIKSKHNVRYQLERSKMFPSFFRNQDIESLSNIWKSSFPEHLSFHPLLHGKPCLFQAMDRNLDKRSISPCLYSYYSMHHLKMKGKGSLDTFQSTTSFPFEIDVTSARNKIALINLGKKEKTLEAYEGNRYVNVPKKSNSVKYEKNDKSKIEDKVNDANKEPSKDDNDSIPPNNLLDGLLPNSKGKSKSIKKVKEDKPRCRSCRGITYFNSEMMKNEEKPTCYGLRKETEDLNDIDLYDFHDNLDEYDDFLNNPDENHAWTYLCVGVSKELMMMHEDPKIQNSRKRKNYYNTSNSYRHPYSNKNESPAFSNPAKSIPLCDGIQITLDGYAPGNRRNQKNPPHIEEQMFKESENPKGDMKGKGQTTLSPDANPIASASEHEREKLSRRSTVPKPFQQYPPVDFEGAQSMTLQTLGRVKDFWLKTAENYPEKFKRASYKLLRAMDKQGKQIAKTANKMILIIIGNDREAPPN